MRLRNLTVASLVLASVASPAVAVPPAPPPPRPFDDPALAARFDAWQTAYDQSLSDASDRLAAARTAIGTARAKGGVMSDEARQTAHDFALAERQFLDRLRDLMAIQNALPPTASAGDRERIRDTIAWQLQYVFATEPNALEVLAVITDNGK